MIIKIWIDVICKQEIQCFNVFLWRFYQTTEAKLPHDLISHQNASLYHIAIDFDYFRFTIPVTNVLIWNIIYLECHSHYLWCHKPWWGMDANLLLFLGGRGTGDERRRHNKLTMQTEQGLNSVWSKYLSMLCITFWHWKLKTW